MDHISLGSNIAVAFSRTPMTLAYAANDVQLASGGRFILGLGSQVKPHVTRRFGMEWSHPAERMRDFVSALRAIWTSWNEQAPLDYRGPFYRHTLMTELFDPGPNSFGAPPIYVAAVNPRMTAVAAETADGMLAHPFTTQRYLREVTLPQLTAVLARAGRPLESFDLVGNPFAAVGRTPEDLARAVGATRKRIAFYASTPADRPVLERHGWGALGERLTAMSRDAMWTEMGQAIPDYVLEEFAVVGEPARVVQMLHERFGDIYDRAIVNTPGCDGPELDPVLRTEAP
jgi:probable F420-dependent oxidoreductase